MSVDGVQQRRELVEAALNVADCPGGHGFSEVWC